MQQILNTIREYQMILPGMHVLAGVSGGADSVCLLYALKEYQKECDYELTVVHVEHGIRGQESFEDAEYVEKLCRELDTPCHVVHCDVIRLAAESGASVEEAAREIRYRIFAETAAQIGADVTAVAHNENDQAETVLWNLIRGSGLKGLGGMQPVRDGIIRPLLFTARTEIERILGERGISYRTDRTNLETDYTRNRLRLWLLPYMEEHLNRAAVRHIAQASVSLREAQSFIDRCVMQAGEHCIRGQAGRIWLVLEEYRQQDAYLQGELLRECIRRCGGGHGLKDIGRIHIGQLRELAEKPCGKMLCLPGGLRVERQDGGLLFYTANSNTDRAAGTDRGKSDRESTVGQSGYAKPDQGETAMLAGYAKPDQGETAMLAGCAKPVQEECICLKPGTQQIGTMRMQAEFFERKDIMPQEIFTENKYTKWLSCDTIVSDICFRKRQTGDYLVINSQGGRRKLKDYMIDQKIPRGRRDDIWLVADGSHVLWLPGYRISEAARVTEDTQKVLKITITIQEEDCI